MTLRVGSDPEVLLINPHGKFISAIGLIGGSKEEPRATQHGFVQEDNVLIEFNPHPAASEQEFVTNTLNVLQDITQLIKPLNLELDIKSSGRFSADQLEHFLARLAGCNPDFDAWEGVENNPPDLAMTDLRTCGGHLHISFDEADEDADTRFALVRAMDLVAGMPSILMDTDTDRRALYGKAGACRPKYIVNGDSYDGVEYRVLSNFWIGSEAKMAWAFRAVQRAVGDLKYLAKAAMDEKDAILTALNTGNADIARSLIDRYSLEVVNG